MATPSLVSKANLGFRQKLMIAHALEGSDRPMWHLAGTINQLRNDMAHYLERPKREQRLGDLRSKLRRLVDQPDTSTLSETASEEQVVGLAIGVCLGELAAWRNAMRAKNSAME